MMHCRLAARLVMAVAVLAMLTGCAASVRIESRVDAQYLGTLDRVAIISQLRDVSERFGAPCEQYLVEAMRTAGVDVQLFSVDPLALEDRLPWEAAADFSPRAILVLDPTAKGGPGLEFISVATVDASLRDAENDRVYWRASVFVQSGSEHTPMGSATARDFARAFVRRLADDGLLPPAS